MYKLIQDSINVVDTLSVKVADSVSATFVVPVSYENLTSQLSVSNQVVSNGAFDIVASIVEYSYLLIILVCIIDLWRNYRSNLGSIMTSLNSDYMTRRFLEKHSLSLKATNFRLLVLNVFLFSIFFAEVEPKIYFGDFCFDERYSMLIYSLIFILMHLLLMVLLHFNVIFGNNYKRALTKIVKLTGVFLSYNIIALLVLFFVANLLIGLDLQKIKIAYTVIYLLSFFYSAFIIIKIFYKENVLFFQYILYFCTVRFVEISIIWYLLWHKQVLI